MSLLNVSILHDTFPLKEKSKNANFFLLLLSTTLCRVYIAIDSKTVFDSIAPHAQGLFCQSDQ